jgi:hypothetical protein
MRAILKLKKNFIRMTIIAYLKNIPIIFSYNLKTKIV